MNNKWLCKSSFCFILVVVFFFGSKFMAGLADKNVGIVSLVYSIASIGLISLSILLSLCFISFLLKFFTGE